MKKNLFLPLFATMAIVSQSWSQWASCSGDYAGYCVYPPSSTCNRISTGPENEGGKATCEEAYDNCIDNGSLYTDAACTEWSGLGKDPSAEALGCCKWDNGKDEYSTIWDTEETKATECQKNAHIFWNEACPANGARPTSNPVYDGSAASCGELYCYWPANADSREGCYKIVKTGGNNSCELEETNCISHSIRNKVFTEATCTTEKPGASSSSGVNTSSSSTTTASSSSYAGASDKFEYCKIGLECNKGPYSFEQCVALSGVPTNTENCTSINSSSSTEIASSSSNAGTGSSSSAVVFSFCKINSECNEGTYTFEQCAALNGIPSNNCSTTPITVLPQVVFSNALKAMQNAVNLHATGNVTIQIFDLKGNVVRSLKFAQGNYIVPLSDLPRGLYIVKAKNASWKQIAKVAVK